jgi:hypothetical protein
VTDRLVDSLRGRLQLANGGLLLVLLSDKGRCPCPVSLAISDLGQTPLTVIGITHAFSLPFQNVEMINIDDFVLYKIQDKLS